MITGSRYRKRALLLRNALCFSILFAFTASNALSQFQSSFPDFAVDFVSVRDAGAGSGSLVDIYTRIPYTSLSFIATANGFMANYHISLSAIEISETDHLRNLIKTKYWDARIITNTYIETQSPELLDLSTQSIELNPGRYIFELEVADENSSGVLVGEFHVVVKDFSAPVSMSDITILESYDEESFSIVPRVDTRLTSAKGGLKIFYETYSDRRRELKIVREVLRFQPGAGVPELSGLLDTAVREGVSTSVVMREEESVILPQGRSQHLIALSIDDLKVGSYSVRVSLMDPVEGVLDVSEKSFSALWGGLAEHIEDIDNAISQMEYIAKADELKIIKSAATDIERIDRFREFWQKHDPTPDTIRNEKMEEYYYRVDSANRHYSAVQDGWKTDRGYIFVTYGEPDYVERKSHTFDYEPYELWIYERMGRQFIFVDKTGFGDYQLLLPAWDERTRLY